MSEQKYYNFDGEELTLEQMIREEPMWIANHIRELYEDIAEERNAMAYEECARLKMENKERGELIDYLRFE